jgi:hypothetical protein
MPPRNDIIVQPGASVPSDAALEVRCVPEALGAESFWLFCGDRPLATGSLKALSRWGFDNGARSIRYGFDLTDLEH